VTELVRLRLLKDVVAGGNCVEEVNEAEVKGGVAGDELWRG